jgi:hypothetical protein
MAGVLRVVAADARNRLRLNSVPAPSGPYRGLLHVHTDFSYDGHVDVATLGTMLRAEKLDFAVLTEHVEGFCEEKFADYIAQCEAHSADDLLLVPGIEYTFKVGADRIEIILIGRESFVVAEDIAGVLEHKRRHDLLAFLPHPLKFKSVADEVLSAVDMIEVWNRRYDGGAFMPTENIDFYRNSILRRGRAVNAAAGVDFHMVGDALDLVTRVNCESLNCLSLCRALRAGEYLIEYRNLKISSRLDIGSGQLLWGKMKRAVRKPLYLALRKAAKLHFFEATFFSSLKKKVKNLLH